ncbi:hypothetical protein [Candidatus Villigracilis saccharophilus]|uniref:hypothetical protein n=1 Tax=Candidatus Villigracilis saccharophilus TaxID=3140684 RepID=UPI003134A60F|nr:hypothetical protein [Anaerolineales bacterium]
MRVNLSGRFKPYKGGRTAQGFPGNTLAQRYRGSAYLLNGNSVFILFTVPGMREMVRMPGARLAATIR